jgi:hypothetical protein
MDLEKNLKIINPDLYSSLEDIRKSCAEIWKDRLLPWFTNHNCDHSKEIIQKGSWGRFFTFGIITLVIATFTRSCHGVASSILHKEFSEKREGMFLAVLAHFSSLFNNRYVSS